MNSGDFSIDVGSLGVHTVRFHKIKGSLDPSHFIFEINVGKKRIRYTTTVKFNDEILDRLKIDWR